MAVHEADAWSETDWTAIGTFCAGTAMGTAGWAGTALAAAGSACAWSPAALFPPEHPDRRNEARPMAAARAGARVCVFMGEPFGGWNMPILEAGRCGVTPQGFSNPRFNPV